MLLEKKFLVIFSFLLLISACGQKAPLYEPPPVQENQKESDENKESKENK